jgi:hypothetical protein
MTGKDFLHGMACQLAYLEGKNDGVNGMCAVIFCLRNRVIAGHENGDLGRIIQSEFIKRMMLKQPTDIPDVRDPSFSQVLGLVEGMLDNSIQDKLSNGALYYGPKPWGSKEKVAVVGKLELWSG